MGIYYLQYCQTEFLLISSKNGVLSTASHIVLFLLALLNGSFRKCRGVIVIGAVLLRPQPSRLPHLPMLFPITIQCDSATEESSVCRYSLQRGQGRQRLFLDVFRQATVEVVQGSSSCRLRCATNCCSYKNFSQDKNLILLTRSCSERRL